MRTPRQHAAETRAIMKTVSKTDAKIFGAVPVDSKKKVALPGLQRALRNDLTLDDKDNGAAARDSGPSSPHDDGRRCR